MRLENLLEADTIGTEVSTRWMPSRRFSLDGSYSYLQIERHTDVVGAVAAQALDDITPRHQWQLHSSAWLTRRIELGAALYHVGQVWNLAIPAYTRADLRFAVNVSDRLSVAVTGQNLTDREHAESVGNALGTGVVRRSPQRRCAACLELRDDPDVGCARARRDDGPCCSRPAPRPDGHRRPS